MARPDRARESHTTPAPKQNSPFPHLPPTRHLPTAASGPIAAGTRPPHLHPPYITSLPFPPFAFPSRPKTPTPLPTPSLPFLLFSLRVTHARLSLPCFFPFEEAGEGAMVEETTMDAGWLTWRAAAVAVAAWVALHVLARVADALWWRPRRLEAHFAAQGVRGPPYRFLLGSVKEMVALMAEASSKPMSPPTSHNALPRVLAFYHYWRKIYGASSPSSSSRFRPCVASTDCSAPTHLFGRFRLRLRDLFPLVSLFLSLAAELLPGLSFCLFLSEQRSFSLYLYPFASAYGASSSRRLVSLLVLDDGSSASCPSPARLAPLAGLAGWLLHSMRLGLDHERSTWEKTCSTFLIWFGPTPRLTVAEPELVKEIFLTRADAFDRYEAHPVVRQLEGDGLVSLHGDKWALHRRVLTDAFFPDNLNVSPPRRRHGRRPPDLALLSVRALRRRSVAKLAEEWRAMAAAGESGEVEVDVAEWFQEVTEEAITRATFGRSYDDGRVVFAMQGRLMAFASEAFRKVLVPGYRYALARPPTAGAIDDYLHINTFLPTKKNWQSWKLDTEIRRSLTRLIARRSDEADAENTCGGEDGGGAFRDLLGAMINAGERRRPSAAAIPVEDMLEECKTFFFAGKQTTTNLLTWATVLLAMHPEWQERARREVLDVCGADEVPSKEHLPKLKTLGMIMNETLRLYPPAVATIRRAKMDVQLSDGCMIPRDMELLVPIMAIHHDTRFWGQDAAQFNPGRAAKHPLAFIPFGLGSRMCIGQNLARLEAKITMAILLQRFEMRTSPKYIHAPTVLMLLHPQYGAPVIFRPRLPENALLNRPDQAQPFF
ncbi:hypothetical protein HU200_006285 [Digitaria exilis]|uniref:Cytochrome P450 n=1 Tax=Digitaria exilis TaxID=1010633 RepID=A0A835FPB8_9POAL|nr:hypothetical protein HU200_006285 [Digitaria exilis]